MDQLPFAHNARREFLHALPVVELATVNPEDSCPVCFTDFATACTSAPEYVEIQDEPPIECAGLTKLTRCGHVFCKRDIVAWVGTSRGSCPVCRDVFLEFPSEEDNESSDGGEYIPGEDDDEDEDMDDFYATDECTEIDDLEMSDWAEDDDYSFSSNGASSHYDDDDNNDECEDASTTNAVQPDSDC